MKWVCLVTSIKMAFVWRRYSPWMAQKNYSRSLPTTARSSCSTGWPNPCRSLASCPSILWMAFLQWNNKDLRWGKIPSRRLLQRWDSWRRWWATWSTTWFLPKIKTFKSAVLRPIRLSLYLPTLWFVAGLCPEHNWLHASICHAIRRRLYKHKAFRW